MIGSLEGSPLFRPELSRRSFWLELYMPLCFSLTSFLSSAPRPAFAYLSRRVLNTMSVKTVAVLDYAEIKDGEMCVFLLVAGMGNDIAQLQEGSLF